MADRVKPLPAWTWALPALLFQFATGLSLNFQIMPRLALWYFPIPLGILLVQWWGPRVLVGLYLNALFSMPYWGHSRWWLWPLYALPETLTVALSWLLFVKLAKGKAWLPDLGNTVKFLMLGILVPSLAAGLWAEVQYYLLGEPLPASLFRAASVKMVLNLLSPIAITVPLLLFASAAMEKQGLTRFTGSHPRPPLLTGDRFTSWMKLEAACIFAALTGASLVLSLGNAWFVFGALLVWTAIRFGIGMTVLACVWTISLTLLLPALFLEGFGATFLTKSEVIHVNMNLAVLCFSALVVGRAMSDLRLENETRKEGENRLLLTAKGVSAAKGENFCRNVMEALAKALDADYAFMAEFTDESRKRVRTIARWEQGKLAPNMEYDLAGTPCENVTGNGRFSIPDGVQELYPSDALLAGMEAEGYSGTPLLDSDGKVMGLIAVLFKRPIKDTGVAESLLRIFAERTGAELARNRAEMSMAENEAKYRTLFESATDAVLLSENGKYLECNRYSLEMFRCEREFLVGKTIAVISPEFQPDGSRSDTLAPAIRGTSAPGQPARFEWTYLRKDGTTFDGEGSLTLLTINGAPQHMVVIRDITDRKRALAALRDNEVKYRTLFESATDGIILAERGKMLECNDRSLELFRCSREELVGKSGAFVYPEFQPDGSHSLMKGRALQDKALLGEPQEFEWTYLRKDGTFFDGEVTLNRIDIGGEAKLMVVIRDITERKLVDRALMESEERFRQMAESIQEIFFLMDRATQTMLYVSPVAEKILGIPLRSIRSRPMAMYDFIHPEDRDKVGFMKNGAWDWRPFNQDYRFQRPDGRTIWLRIRTFLINDAEGRPIRVAGVISDITEYKVAQEAAREHQQQLMQADKMNSLGLMVSGVAHEINNPNNLIMLNSDVMETFWKHMRPALRSHARSEQDWKLAGIDYDNAEGKFELLLQGVAGGARRIKRIVDNLKDFARMDGGGMAESIAVDKVIDASVSIVENLIRKSTDHFSILHGENLPRINGNFQKLEQVVINLITNACQALENRTKAIFIETRHDRERDEVAILVRDQGAGIPAELIAKVSDPFFTTRRDKGGTGLGLSVSYGIIKEHHGRMELRSEAGRGTEVEIRIPAKAGKETEEQRG